MIWRHKISAFYINNNQSLIKGILFDSNAKSYMELNPIGMPINVFGPALTILTLTKSPLLY